MTEYEEHPVLKQFKQHRGYDAQETPETVFKAEALKFAALNPAERGKFLHDFDTELEKHPDVNLRQRAQMHRFKSYLRGADSKLKLVGR
jgi:hypothetical protein